MDAQALTVRVCTGLCCGMAGANELAKALPELLGGMAPVTLVPCIGRCDEAPAVLVGKLALPMATQELVLNLVVAEQMMPAQARGLPDPLMDFLDCEGYRAEGGYSQLASIAGSAGKCASALAAIDASGLGCSGGAPLASQLHALREAGAPRELGVCVNGTGPAGFRDRQLIERDPHRFLEGLLIAAQMAGAESMTVFLPGQLELCRAMLQQEWEELAANPPCTLPGLAFDDGDAPEDSLSCEALFWVRDILEKGADWYGGFGRQGCRGLRALAVAGRVADPGVKVAPAGITLHELIEEFCGGMAEGQHFRAAIAGEATGAVVVLGAADHDGDSAIGETLRDASAVLK